MGRLMVDCHIGMDLNILIILLVLSATIKLEAFLWDGVLQAATTQIPVGISILNGLF